MTSDNEKSVSCVSFEHYGLGMLIITYSNTAAAYKKVDSLYDTTTQAVVSQRFFNRFGLIELKTVGEFYTEERGQIIRSFKVQDASEKPASFVVFASRQIRSSLEGYDKLLDKAIELENCKVLNK